MVVLSKVPNAAGPPTESEEMDLNIKEEVLLDENTMGSRHPFYGIGEMRLSPNHKLVAYTEDLLSDERYYLRVKVRFSISDFNVHFSWKESILYNPWHMPKGCFL